MFPQNFHNPTLKELPFFQYHSFFSVYSKLFQTIIHKLYLQFFPTEFFGVLLEICTSIFNFLQYFFFLLHFTLLQFFETLSFIILLLAVFHKNSKIGTFVKSFRFNKTPQDPDHKTIKTFHTSLFPFAISLGEAY